MKVMDALSDMRVRQGRADRHADPDRQCGPGVPRRRDSALGRTFCCGPHGPWLNRFLDTPLPKIRMSGWLFYRLGAKGFLHWGFNYWHKMERDEIVRPVPRRARAAPGRTCPTAIRS